MTENVTIIIPTYNEKYVIADTIKALIDTFHDIDTHQFKLSILVNDSNSPDGTANIVRELQNQYHNVFLLVEDKKSGLGSAYIHAMQYAIERLKADIIFEFDADGSHQPKYLPAMLQILKQGADVVVGSRYIKNGSLPRDWSWNRKFLSYFGNLTARLILTWRYTDFTSGYRGSRVRFLKRIQLDKLLSKNYAYKMHLFWELHRLKANIVEFPIEFIDRNIGYSKFPKNSMIDSLRVIILLRLFAFKKYLGIHIRHETHSA
jgi:dolichol-phosphate mannosyltransferase